MYDLGSLKGAMKVQGVQRLYAKVLSPNDNSKNQVYFGQGFSSINILPVTDVRPDPQPGKPQFKAKVSFSWLRDDGTLSVAPGAQLILYPQYPEVRFSGFLAGCEHAPSNLMTSRAAGRVLFLGVTADKRMIGYVAAGDSTIAQGLADTELSSAVGVFLQIELDTEQSYRNLLLATLARVHSKGWIDSRRLLSDGSSVPCNAPQCGGYTLEAEFGITPNGISKPDFWGWEIKQYGVRSFANLDSGVITLMTPEPTGGYYKEKGVAQFIRRYGYADMRGRVDRLNFGGIHRYGHRTGITGLTLTLVGYDSSTGKIASADGGLALTDNRGDCAAIWHYSGLLALWNKKHARAAYVPSITRRSPRLQYMYGPTARLGTGTEFLLFLKAIAAGLIYYDPGIKLEAASSAHPVSKRRSQFRIKPAHLCSLYDKWELVTLPMSSISIEGDLANRNRQ